MRSSLEEFIVDCCRTMDSKHLSKVLRIFKQSANQTSEEILLINVIERIQIISHIQTMLNIIYLHFLLFNRFLTDINYERKIL